MLLREEGREVRYIGGKGEIETDQSLLCSEEKPVSWLCNSIFIGVFIYSESKEEEEEEKRKDEETN